MTDPRPDDDLRNSFYRKTTRSSRRMTPARRLLYRLAVPLGLAIIKSWLGACRVVRVVGVENLDAALAKAPSLIPCYWHQHQLFCARYLLDQRVRGLTVGWLISPSVDGELGAMMVRRIGGGVIRGSSSHTGARSLRDYYQALVKDQLSPVITPDGPRGPRFKFKPGAILLAQMSGRPMLPMAYAAARAWLVKWDKFVIPVPFTRVVIAIGTPRYVPRVTDAAAMEQLQADMEVELKKLYQVAAAGLRGEFALREVPGIRAAAMDETALEAAGELPPLVMRFGAFGDMVLLTVLLRQLHARFGKPVDVISSGPWTKPLLEGQPSVGRLFVIRSRRTPYWMSLDQRRLVAWLRKRGAGPTWFCDIHLGKDLLHRGRIPDEYICDSRSFKWLPDEGFADRYIRLANETPAAFAGRLPAPHPPVSRAAQIVLTTAARAEADEWLARHQLTGRPFIVIHPGSRHIARRGLRSRAGSDKYWPEARWGQVIKTVRDLRPDHAVLLSGTPKERKFNADIMASAAVTDVHNVADDLPIRTLLPLLERAHSMISVDTGPAHAAAALGCPTVSLFGTANAALFRPGGATTAAVALTGTVNGVQNILGITAESVIAAWFDLIRTAERHAAHSVKSLTCD